MEEDFKKMKEGNCKGGGCSLNVMAGVDEGAEEIINRVMEEGKEVLDCDFEEGRAVGLPSWEANIEKVQDVLDCVNGKVAVLDGEMLGDVGKGDDCELLGGLDKGIGRGVSCPIEKVVLDWRKAVVEGNGRKGGAAEEVGVESAVSPCGRGGNGVGGGEKASQGRTAKGSVDDCKPGKHCRELHFDKGVDSFLGADGITVQVDKEAVVDCEKELERAVVGKILGRQVPFGFLNRELRKQWGKFGRAHLSMVGKNSFVCFFSTKEVRDKVLRGGPWFVGNQLVGIARWSSAFDPSSIKGFSTPIWVRFPHLPLNLWSDQNLGRFAAMIGQPLWVDEVTSSWGRTEFARVCVRINFEKKLPKGIWIQGVESRFFQAIEYEGIDQICFHCGGVGHVNGSCLERGRRMEEGDGGDVPVGASQVVGGEVERGASVCPVGDPVEGQKVVVPPIFGHVVSQISQKGLGNSGDGVGDAGRQRTEVGGYVLEAVQNSGGSFGEVGREDLEGGGWMFVAKKKPGKQFKKQGTKPRGFPLPERRRRGVLDDRKEHVGEGSVGVPGRKLMMVYKRGERNSSRFVSSGVVGGSVAPSKQLGESSVVGRSVVSGTRAKRPLEIGVDDGRDLGGSVDGEPREIEPGALVIFQPDLAVSLMEEVEGLKKRRKGGEEFLCGGDASPLVV